MLAAGTALGIGMSAGLRSLMAAAESTTAPSDTAAAPSTRPTNKRFLIAADDLFLLQRQKLKAFAIAQKCGLDGISVDMGGMPQGKELKNELRDPALRQQFLDESKRTGVQIASMAFFGMYAHVYADMPIALDITQEWVDLMVKMGSKIGFMPLMTKDGTMAEPEHADVRKRTIDILKKVALWVAAAPFGAVFCRFRLPRAHISRADRSRLARDGHSPSAEAGHSSRGSRRGERRCS